MPGALQGLGPLPSPEGAYRYVLFNAFIVTVTTRSVRLAAATASLSFVALQVIHSISGWPLRHTGAACGGQCSALHLRV